MYHLTAIARNNNTDRSSSIILLSTLPVLKPQFLIQNAHVCIVYAQNLRMPVLSGILNQEPDVIRETSEQVVGHKVIVEREGVEKTEAVTSRFSSQLYKM